jgi:uncharacterized membrane protein
MAKLRYWLKKHPTLVRVVTVFFTAVIVSLIPLYLFFQQAAEESKGQAVKTKQTIENARNSEINARNSEVKSKIEADVAKRMLDDSEDRIRKLKNEAAILKLKLAEQQAGGTGDSKEGVSDFAPKAPE